MDKQYAGTAAGNYYPGEAAVKQSPIGSLYEAMNYLRESTAMARNTADQLCGGQPEAIGKDQSPKNGSHFGQIEDIAEEVRNLAARVSGDMQRIQSRL